MAKIVYNACYGGFSLSTAAVLRGKELSQSDDWNEVDPAYGFFRGPRHDDVLVQVVEELGESASGSCARLRIEEIEAGAMYRIDEYDGNESVMTNNDYQWTIAP